MTFGVFSTPVAGAEPLAPPPRWTFSIADLRTGIILADLPWDNVEFSMPLNDSGPFSADLTLDDTIAPQYDVRDLTTPARRAWYAVRDNRPMYGGIIWTSTYDSESQQVSIGGADFWSYFDARRILPVLNELDPAQVNEIAALAVSYDNEDLNEIARSLVALAQSHTGGDLGIQVDGSFSGLFRERNYYGYDLRNFGETLRQLAEVGPDMRFTIVADPSAPSGIARRLIMGEPWLGQQGSEHVWEFGGNLTSYTWPRDGSGMATRAFALGDGMEKGQPIAWSEDAALYDSGWPLLEAETSYTTVRTESVLIEHAQADQFAARAPIALPTFHLRPGIAPHLGEYSTGDDCRVIIKDRYWGGADGFPGTGLDTLVRIVDTQVSYSADDAESVDIVCAPLVEGII